MQPEEAPSVSDFARSFAALLPNFQTVTGQSVEYWNKLEVRADELIPTLQDIETVSEHPETAFIGPGILQAICLWIGCCYPQADETTFFRGKLVENASAQWSQDLFCLMKFVFNRRYDAIQTISRSLLPENVFDLISESLIDDKSRRLAFAMQVYYTNPSQLQLLSLFEKVEMFGYNRHRLVEYGPDSETARDVNDAVCVKKLTKEIVKQTLAAFEEAQRSKRNSICLDIHHDNGTALIFVLRDFRENYIREVEGTVFADEAELIVLKISNQMHVLEEHSEQGIGPKIAEHLARHFFKGKNVGYERDSALTKLEDLQRLLSTLQVGSDPRVYLHEIHLDHSPLPDSPTLIIRANSRKRKISLSSALESLTDKNIEPLEDIKKLRSVGIQFESPVSNRSNIFKLQFIEKNSDQYLVLYFLPGGGVSTAMRLEFERYLIKTYNVTVVPKSKDVPRT